MCARLTLPHPGHLFKVVTSFKAFPASCRDLFLLYDVFFFGTARSTDSHISCSVHGMVIVTGRVKLSMHLRSIELVGDAKDPKL